MSNPTTNRLLSKLLADPEELVTEPVRRTNETVDAQIGLTLRKVVEMVRMSMSIFCAFRARKQFKMRFTAINSELHCLSFAIFGLLCTMGFVA